MFIPISSEGEGEGETDTTAPVITLNGNADVTVEACSDYTELGATATDAVDGVVTVVTSGSVVLTVPDVYTITYTAEDSAGNDITATRTVTVVDTTPPVITLLGSTEVEVEQGDTFNDEGASAHDGCRGFSHITWETHNFVDTAVVGVFTLTYTATDDAGNSATATRTVTVVAPSELETAYYVPLGSPATLEVPAVPDAIYQWQYSGSIASPDGNWVNVVNMVGTIGGATTNRLNFAAVQTSDGRWYRCLVNGVASPIIYLFPEQSDMVWIDFSRVEGEQPEMTVTPAMVDRFFGSSTASVIGVTIYLERAPWVLNQEVDISGGPATVTLGDFDQDFDGDILYFEVYGKTSSGTLLTPDLNYFGLTSPNGDRVRRLSQPSNGAYNFGLPWTQVDSAIDGKALIDAIMANIEG
jgi:hypothetical protein